MRQFPQLVMLQLLRAYKWALSPLFPPSCRYVPSCSEYAIEAVDRFGALRGGMKALLRLLRCHPFAQGGYDPVTKRRDAGVQGERPALNQQRLLRPTTARSEDTAYFGRI